MRLILGLLLLVPSTPGLASASWQSAAQEAQTGELLSVRELLEQALQTAVTIKGGFLKEYALRDIAAAQARAGDVTGALQTAAAIKEGSMRSAALRDIALAQVRAGDQAAAARTLEQAVQAAAAFNPALQNIAVVRAELGDVAGALQVAADVEVEFMKYDTLVDIARVLSDRGDFTGALRAAAAIPDDKHWKSTSLSDIAQAQAKAGDMAAATSTFEESLRIATALKAPGALVSVATARAKAGDLEGAFRTAALIKKYNHKKSSQNFLSFALRGIAAAQAGNGDLVGALQTAFTIEGDVLKEYALRDIAVAQARAGDVTGALQTASTIQGDSAKSHTMLIAIAEAQAKAGDRAAAARTFEQAFQSLVNGPMPPGRVDDVLVEIAAAQVRAADLKGALRTAALIKTYTQKSVALRGIAAAQARVGDVTAALRTADDIEHDGTRIETLKDIAAAQARAGQVNSALAMAKKKWRFGGRLAQHTRGTRQLAKHAKALILVGIAEGILDRLETKQTDYPALEE